MSLLRKWWWKWPTKYHWHMVAFDGNTVNDSRGVVVVLNCLKLQLFSPEQNVHWPTLLLQYSLSFSTISDAHICWKISTPCSMIAHESVIFLQFTEYWSTVSGASCVGQSPDQLSHWIHFRRFSGKSNVLHASESLVMHNLLVFGLCKHSRDVEIHPRLFAPVFLS